MKTLINNAFVYSSETETFRKGSLLFSDRIIDVGEVRGDADTVIDADEALLVPGFVDVHTHGRAGYDFTDADEENLKKMAESYLSVGTTSLFPTLASAEYAQLLTMSDKINALKGNTSGAEFLGIHLEGRYLNPNKRGAHAKSLLAPFDEQELEELVFRMRTPCHISSALELNGGMLFAKKARSLGATLGLAHTEADYETAMTAYRDHSVSFTHLFNAMPSLGHRESGAVAAGLTSGAYCELICDGLHIAPEMIKLAYRCLGNRRLSLITDSMMASGCDDGEYFIAGNPCTVKNGKALTHEGKLAGSTLDMKTALENLMRFCDIPLETALRCATLTPAEQVGVDKEVGSINIGKRSDLLLIRNVGGSIKIEKTFVGGKRYDL